ncbi:MAG: VWA domain-containing protein [Haliea sp.]|nr:VWA domain-containing protein [Haliea sp.]
MAKRKRSFTTFNLSFLDIMSCGFGAVILVFLIIDHSIVKQSQELNRDLLSEVDLLDEDITEGEAGLVKLRNALSAVDQQMVDAQGQATRVTEAIDEYQALIVALGESVSTSPDIERLKSQIQSLEEEVKRLRESAEATSGSSAREFTGDGNRQYLTGLNLGGRHIVILLDVSSSMLADRLVNIIRLRNMAPEVQRSAEKWSRALNTVDWLTAQLPVGSNYQIITFNTAAEVALPNTAGKWLEVANQPELESATRALRQLLPSGGTSLENAFIALGRLSPAPDNIFLITDGLPTHGTSAPRGSTVTGRQRIDFYQQALRRLPRNVPVNIILAPMEGDPMAASAFWQLAQATRGSFMSPSRDWP